MIIGSGLIAKTFNQYETQNDFFVFASGVSNSKSCKQDELRREEELFISSVHANSSKKVVYFGTTSVDDPDLQDTSYISHKLAMEDLVKKMAARWHIFRLPNLAGASGNPHTLLNFFYNCIMEGRAFELWKYSERNVIDVADVYRCGHYILQRDLFPNTVVNIANPGNYSVAYIVKCIEERCGVKAVSREREKGRSFTIDVSDVLPLYKELKMAFNDDYLPGVLEKYYPKK